METPELVVLPISSLPSAANIDFTETAFFQNSKLKYDDPTPAEVHAKAISSSDDSFRPLPVIFELEYINVIVKYGRYPGVSIEEGQCYWAIKGYLPSVPVPSIYGWRTDQNTREVFLYLELVEGITLNERWKDMNKDMKEAICEQLRYRITELKRLRREGDSFIRYIRYQPLLDIIFTTTESGIARLFLSVKEFHDYSLSIALRRFPDALDVLLLSWVQFPDDTVITFSYNDLDESNIFLSKSDPSSLVAIADWHQRGWHPEHWEQCKARWGNADYEWGEDYLPKSLSSRTSLSEQGFQASCVYNDSLGVI